MNIISSDKIFYEGPCQYLTIPAPDGQKGVLPHHENMVIAVDPGELKFQKPDGEWVEAVVSMGFAEIMNNRVSVLVNTAERPEDIDVNRARRAADEAKEAMLQKKSIQEYRSAQASLARAISRLRVKSNYMEGKQ